MGLNATGLNVNDRRETWLFSEVEQKQGKPVYRRMQWNIVQYGDDPEEFLEPANTDNYEDTVGFGGPISGTRPWGFRFIKGKLCDVHCFNDYDAANFGYVDPGVGRTPTGF